MNRTLPNITKYHQRYFFVFIAVFVLFTCPIKSSIKDLVGIPVNTEQGFAKKSNPIFANGIDQCTSAEIADAKISQTPSFAANDLLPAIIFAVTFLFLLGFMPRKEQSHPLYGGQRIPKTLPLFLLYQKLIVYHTV